MVSFHLPARRDFRPWSFLKHQSRNRCHECASEASTRFRPGAKRARRVTRPMIQSSLERAERMARCRTVEHIPAATVLRAASTAAPDSRYPTWLGQRGYFPSLRVGLRLAGSDPMARSSSRAAACRVRRSSGPRSAAHRSTSPTSGTCPLLERIRVGERAGLENPNRANPADEQRPVGNRIPTGVHHSPIGCFVAADSFQGVWPEDYRTRRVVD